MSLFGLDCGTLTTEARFLFSRRHVAIRAAKYGLAIRTDYSLTGVI